MKNRLSRWHHWLLLLLLLLLASAPSRAAPSLVMLVGDSTMATRSGYGDALCQRLQPVLACLNLGRGGRSTLSYRAEGLWDAALDQLKQFKARAPAGPAYVLIQFGHNDQPGKPGRSTDLATEFSPNLLRYLADVRGAGAVPVLVTPLTRRSFDGEVLADNLKPWADAVRKLAADQQVALIDLHAQSAALVQTLGQARADELAEAAPGQPRFDRTHLGAKGACVFAQMMSLELARQVPALDQSRSPAPDCALVAVPGG